MSGISREVAREWRAREWRAKGYSNFYEKDKARFASGLAPEPGDTVTFSVDNGSSPPLATPGGVFDRLTKQAHAEVEGGLIEDIQKAFIAGPDRENDFTDNVCRVFEEGANLLLEKHRGYGPSNIADAPGGPLNGLRVRLYDKLARLNHMVDTGIDTAASESLRDTAIDILNYGAILVLVLDGKWPSV